MKKQNKKRLGMFWVTLFPIAYLGICLIDLLTTSYAITKLEKVRYDAQVEAQKHYPTYAEMDSIGIEEVRKRDSQAFDSASKINEKEINLERQKLHNRTWNLLRFFSSDY